MGIFWVGIFFGRGFPGGNCREGIIRVGIFQVGVFLVPYSLHLILKQMEANKKILRLNIMLSIWFIF